MKDRTKKIPIQKIEPNGEKTSYKIIGWTAFLACMFLVGGVMIILKSWDDLAPSIWTAGGMAFAGILSCILEKWITRRYSYGWLVRIFPWVILLVAGTPLGCLNGAKAWVNVLITKWNLAYNGGTELFSVRASGRDVLVFTLFWALILGQAAWILAEEHSRVVGMIFCIVLITVEVVGNTLDPWASSFLLIAFLGMNVSDAGTMVTRNGFVWMSGIGVLLLAGAAFLSKGELQFAYELRENVRQTVHEIRYGEDSLPEGDLREAATLHQKEETMLQVQSEQEKSLYLRGFVGSSYEDGVWKKMPDLAYSGDNAGMLKWLLKKEFDPLTQVADYYRIGESQDAPEANRIKYRIGDASRYYVYLPSTLKEVTDGSLKEKKDIRYSSRGIIGEKNYAIEEVSGSRPSELTVADDWVTDPQTKAQKEYCGAEAVYRQFVYDNYTKADADLAELIRTTFWDDYETENEGIYSSLTHIREVLKERVQYTDTPSEVPEGVDPIRYFLNGSHQGNAMLYASTAVEALRLHGIPARYIEGYYVSENDIAGRKDGTAAVTGQDAHAWAEVYFDGIGWLPVDVTPGYYYESVALQQMVGVPDTVRQNASLGNNSFEADQITGGSSTGAKKQEVFRLAGTTVRILFGIVAVLLILVVIIFALAEVLRVFAGCVLKKQYDRTDGETQIARAEMIISRYLKLWGIEAHLGWNTEETDRMIAKKITAVRAGEYSRVCELLEKSIYGEIELEPYEKRTLNQFMKKLTVPGEKCSLKMKMILRYACLHFLGT